eukprot:2935960-Pyramimonas_sp.AAC.1
MLDLKSAFHTVIMNMILDCPTDPELFDDFVTNMEIPQVLVPALKKRLAQPGRYARSMSNDHLVHMLSEVNKGAWWK